jgi:transposase
VTRARLWLKADEDLTDTEIAAALDVGIATVGRTRQRVVEATLAALEARPRPGGERQLTGTQAAHLSAVACTPAPAGQRRWTRRWLADKVVECGLAAAMARETGRQVLKNMSSRRGGTSRGVCPP